MAKVPLKFTFDNVEDGIQGIMAKLGAALLRRNLNQIQQRGLNPKGQRFKPYSAAYRKKRKEHGRTIKIVNLTLTRRMVQYLKILVVKKTRAIIGFSSARQNEKAGYVKGMKGEFLGATKKNEADLQKMASKMVGEILNRNKTHVIKKGKIS